MLATAAVREVASGTRVRSLRPESLAVAFVVRKKEGLILLNRPAQRSAELIALEVGNLRKVEEIPRVQGAVAQELIGVAVHLGCAGGCHDVDLGAGSFSIFGAIGVLHQGEFLHRVHAQKLSARPSRGVVDLGGAGEFHPVQEVKILLRAAARNCKHIADHRVRGARAARPLRRVVNDAWVQREELVVTPAVQRQVFHLALADKARHVGRGYLHGKRGSFHLNRLVDPGDGEGQIQIGALSEHERDILLHGAEAVLLRRKPGTFPR